MKKLLFTFTFLITTLFVSAQTQQEWVQRGIDQLANEDYAGAVTSFSAAIEQGKYDGDLYAKRASAYAGLFDFNKAIEDIRIAIAYSKKDKQQLAELYQTLAGYHKLNANFDEAIKALNDGIRALPELNLLYFERAQAFYDKGDLNGAIKEFMFAKTKFQFDLDNTAEIDCKLAEIHYKKKIFDQAIKYYTMALDNRPEKAKALYGRAKAYREITEYTKSIDDITRCIQYYAEDKENLATLFYLSGYCKNKINDRYGAIIDYTSAIENYRDYPEAYLSRGLCYKQTKQFSEALKDFTRAVELNEKDPMAYFERAKVNNDLNNHVEARLDFNKVLDLDAGKGPYKPYILFYMNKNQREAINEMNRRLYENAELRKDPEYMRQEYYSMACIQSLCGNLEEAYTYLDSSLMRLTNDYERNKWEVKDDELVQIKYTDRFKVILERYRVKYSITPTLSYLIEKHMLSKFETWKKKGEFEKKVDYELRMKGYAVKQKSLINEAIDSLKKVQIKNTKWTITNLSTYDSESETFKISISGMPDIIVPVPIADAPSFKSNISMVALRNPDLKPKLDQWEISHLEFEDRVTKKLFAYNSSEQKNYDVSQQYAFNFGKASIDIPGVDILAKSPVKDAGKPKTILLGKSDVDTDLPPSRMVSPDAIAVVIGNRDYSKTKPVDFAINDAASIKRYLVEVAGFKEGNIIYRENATQGEFNTIFGTRENANGMLMNLVKPGISEVFIFYSGHGCPGLKDKKGYIVPVECDPGYVEIGGYSLDLLYSNLAKVPAKTMAVVTDACFSGAAFENISPMVIKMDEPVQSLTNAVIISSSTGDQVSSWYNEQEHGMFTYYFLKAIQNKKGSDLNADGMLTYQEIFDFVANSNEGVPYMTRKLRGITQTPVIQGSLKESVFIRF